MTRKLSPSTAIYLALIALLAILAAASVFLPQGSLAAAPTGQAMPAPRPVLALISALTILILYGGLGYVGLRLARRLGFPEIWEPGLSNRQRFLTPALVGVGVGVFFILGDTLLKRLRPLGELPHPPFPTSLVAAAAAGIGEEVIFRLFFISFWMWLVSSVLLRGRGRREVFWGAAVLSALTFAMAHLPSVMFAMGITSVNDVPPALMVELILLNGVLSLFAAYYFRKTGFLAAVGIHFWTDIVWHVIWGLLV